MPKTLYIYMIVPTEGEKFPNYFATHHKEGSSHVTGKFVLYNEDEIVAEIKNAYIKGWSREKA